VICLAQGGIDPDSPVLYNAKPIGGANPGSGSCSLERFKTLINFHAQKGCKNLLRLSACSDFQTKNLPYNN
jgi:hypothetical protein